MTGVVRLIAAALLVGCNGKPSNDAPPGGECPPGSWVTWDNFAEPLVTTWCLPCHTHTLPLELRQGAPLGLDFDSYAGVAAAADRMVARISVQANMPPVAGPTTEERAWFAEWVACGMPSPPPPVDPDPCAELTWIEGDAGPDLCAQGNAVRGNVTLDAASDLSCLCEIEDDLVLAGSGVREAPLLRAVGGSLTVVSTAVTSISFPALASVGDSVLVTGNTGLTGLDLGAVATVGAEVAVSGNQLETLDLTGLVTVPGDLRITDDGALAIVDLARLATVGATLEISRLPSLHTIRNPDAIRTVGTDLLVEENGQLTLFGAFAGVTNIGGSLRIRAIGITNLDGFLDLTAVGGDLVVADNPSLSEIAGFEALTTIGGLYDVHGNTELSRILAPPALTTVGSSLQIAANPELAGLFGFSSLTGVGGSITVTAMDRLATVVAFPAVTAAGSIGFTNNPQLTSITGLAGLETCGELTFVETPALLEIPVLPQLVTVGALEVDRTAVADLDGFAALRMVDGYVRIESNPALTSVDGLGGVLTITGALTITDNPVLPTSDADDLASTIDVSGPVDISGNGP